MVFCLCEVQFLINMISVSTKKIAFASAKDFDFWLAMTRRNNYFCTGNGRTRSKMPVVMPVLQPAKIRPRVMNRQMIEKNSMLPLDNLQIRRLTESDLGAAMRLKEAADWNQTERDWRRLLSLEPEGCFATSVGNRLVATTTTTIFGRSLAWIGMVLVDPLYQRRGIGTRMMVMAMDYLKAAGIETIKLDATPAGKPVYEKLGFVGEGIIEHWLSANRNPKAHAESPLAAGTLQKVHALDKLAFGADRSALLDSLILDSCLAPEVVMGENGEAMGYALARKGTKAAYLGPVIAIDEKTATILLDRMLGQLAGESIYTDFHTGFSTNKETLLQRGFTLQRSFVRMRYGAETSPTSSLIFAIAGPEVG